MSTEKVIISKKNRIIEIDVLRGIAVLFMIFDHFMYDIWDILPALFKDFPNGEISNALYNLSVTYWKWDLRIIVRYIIVFIFMSLVGVCASFSKTNIKRGLKLLGVAMILTLGTYIFSLITGNSSMIITFGTLHCIALSLIFVGILEKFNNNKWLYLILGIIMLAFGIYFDTISYYTTYSSENIFVIILKQILGLVKCGGDTMAFLFNGGQVLIGVFIGKILYTSRKSVFNKEYTNNIVTFTGRNSLLVYFLHQIILPVLLCLIALIFGFTLNV